MSEEVKNNEFTFENPAYRQTYWHTCSHVMAQAVKRLWPEVKLAIGPSIDEGWYYDLDAPFAFTPEHLEKIEAEMRKICKEKLKLERFELPREEAIKFMDALKLACIVTHVADARTCVLHPASHTHRQLTDEQLMEAGVAPDLIRLSVGIEDANDIIADLEQALEQIK